MKCKLCCGRVLLGVFAVHIADCAIANVDCPNRNHGCFSRPRRTAVDDHVLRQCRYVEVTCRNCHLAMLRLDMPGHREVCPLEPVHCPLYGTGHCSALFLSRCELPKHLEEHNAEHLLATAEGLRQLATAFEITRNTIRTATITFHGFREAQLTDGVIQLREVVHTKLGFDLVCWLTTVPTSTDESDDFKEMLAHGMPSDISYAVVVTVARANEAAAPASYPVFSTLWVESSPEHCTASREGSLGRDEYIEHRPCSAVAALEACVPMTGDLVLGLILEPQRPQGAGQAAGDDAAAQAQGAGDYAI